MTDFSEADDLRGAQFREVDLTGARFRSGNLTNVKMTDMWLVNVDIDGLVNRVTINGVDVVPFVVAELDRRHPERKLLNPTDAAGMREAWSMLTSMWEATVERACRLPEEKLFVSVDDEWSFAETLRHLVFAMDKWFTTPVLGEKYDPIGLPNTGSGNLAFLGIDHDAQPTFAEVLASRRARMSRLTEYLADVTAEDLARQPSGGRCRHPIGASLPPRRVRRGVGASSLRHT